MGDDREPAFDVSMFRLGVALRDELAEIRRLQEKWPGAGWDYWLSVAGVDAQYALDHGIVARELAACRFTRETCRMLAALALRPGGFRLNAVIFCARHYPRGLWSDSHYGCSRCDPDSYTRDRVTMRYDRRDVITREGGVYL